MEKSAFKKSVFNQAVTSGLDEIVAKGYQLEQIKEKPLFIKKYGGLNAVFAYARWLEMNFEANLREDYERKTTFTSDLSIAEWCESAEKGATIDTMKRVILEWHTNKEFFAELVIATNLKSREHSARGNSGWSSLYADLYHLTKDLYLMWNGDDKEAIDYYYNYVD